jgi:hypothetical protein
MFRVLPTTFDVLPRNPTATTAEFMQRGVGSVGCREFSAIGSPQGPLAEHAFDGNEPATSSCAIRHPRCRRREPA